MQEIYKFESIRTIWANPENPMGQKGNAAKERDGRKGAPCLLHFKPGETRILAQAEGAGIIRHIWITTEKREKPQTLKGYRLDFYWDGAEKPAVSVPLGDFFCFNAARLSPMENEFFSNPEGRSFNCYIPMPFRKSMKMTITNETKNIEEIQLFYQIDYTLGDDVKDAMYFHAYYNRDRATKSKCDYEILPKLNGKGRFLGASFGVIANPLMAHSWWGEGEVKCYIDGDDAYPTLAGTGTEDYIGTGWGLGEYCNRYQGCTFADQENMRFSFYRFHVTDPIFFAEDIRVTIQQIGCTEKEDITRMLDNGLDIFHTTNQQITYEDNGAIFERFDDDWCSVAYFYLDQPESNLAPLLPCTVRMDKYQW